MTAKRNDNHSTEFGLWLREQREIDSEKGYVATNLDYIWSNYKTGKWMLIEEKRYMSQVKRWQSQLFGLIIWCAKIHPKFCGFHVIRFEKTNPDDGKIYWNDREITKEDLLRILMFSDGAIGGGG